ncbi:sensor of ECF-type sigma factor [Flavobacterium sp.]|uniref:sensor of ECF-type sigma factor n=1 Tax=Flavobacterium sp. TaxID=239 RepID=UPI00260D4EAC|nr:sensor of ECF-type sigma factor [Flavobacterium sp.]MDG2431630.1 sensor of ECF-type sigma factor [Flavobacterium sp.]
MNIKKIFSILCLLASCSFYAQGESMKEKKEQIKALKVSFITTELDLSTKEAEKFWPIYNTFDDKQFEIRHQKMRMYKSRMNDESLNKMSERDASILLSQIEDSEEELFNLRNKFSKDLKEVISAVKIIKLKKAEEDFNRKLLQQYRSKK